MNFLTRLFSLILIVTLLSCDNEVEINDDFEEVTTVFGLLSLREDTQFVKITRTFLDNNQSAIQLANDPDRLYYDSLNVSLKEELTGKIIPLSKTIVPKEPGLFTQEDNEVYFTTEGLLTTSIYTLKVIKPNGDSTLGETRVTDGITISKPDARRGSSVNFVDFRKNFTDYSFLFKTGSDIGEFETKMVFKYIEIINNDSTEKTIVLPLGRVKNDDLREDQEFTIIFEGFRFYEAIRNAIPADINSPRRVLPNDNINIIVDAADADYTLFRDINGPIDGLAQTRPEYTNIENGIGLFSSRSINIGNSRLNDDSRNYLFELYGRDANGNPNNPSEFRGFSF